MIIIDSEGIMLSLKVMKDIVLKMFTDTRIEDGVRTEWFEELAKFYRDLIDLSGGEEH